MTKHLILAILILALGACSKDDGSLIPNIYTGTASALKNGKEWSSLAYFEVMNSYNPKTFILRTDVYNDSGIWRETFDIRRILPNFDIQEITSTDNQNTLDLLSAGYGTLIEDGDVVGDIYELDTTATNNFIQITNYNSERAEIKGKFNVSLVLTRDDGYGDVPPQTLEFTNGEFTVKVEREWFE